MSEQAQGGEEAKGTTGTTEPTKTITGEPSAPGKSLIGDQGAEGKPGEKGAAKPEGDKGTADFKLKIPEGMDEKAAEPYLASAKKHGLKGEAAQEFFDLAVQARAEAAEALEKDISSTWAKTQEAWLTEAKNDKEIGGEKFKESVGLADKFVMRFGGDGLMDALIKSGLGKHPAVIKAFAKAGREISEDKISGTTGVGTSTGKMSEKAILQRDYPNSPDMWKHLPD